MAPPDDVIGGPGPEPGTGREGEAKPFTRARLVAQLHELGVRPGGVLLVHTSYRAVRPVEDGPTGLIAALAEAVGGGRDAGDAVVVGLQRRAVPA